MEQVVSGYRRVDSRAVVVLDFDDFLLGEIVIYPGLLFPSGVILHRTSVRAIDSYYFLGGGNVLGCWRGIGTLAFHFSQHQSPQTRHIWHRSVR